MFQIAQIVIITLGVLTPRIQMFQIAQIVIITLGVLTPRIQMFQIAQITFSRNFSQNLLIMMAQEYLIINFLIEGNKLIRLRKVLSNENLLGLWFTNISTL